MSFSRKRDVTHGSPGNSRGRSLEYGEFGRQRIVPPGITGVRGGRG